MHDLPRPNADWKLSDEKVEELIRTTLQTKPRGQTHWTPEIKRWRRRARRCSQRRPQTLRLEKSAEQIIAAVARHCQRALDLYGEEDF